MDDEGLVVRDARDHGIRLSGLGHERRAYELPAVPATPPLGRRSGKSRNRLPEVSLSVMSER